MQVRSAGIDRISCSLALDNLRVTGPSVGFQDCGCRFSDKLHKTEEEETFV